MAADKWFNSIDDLSRAIGGVEIIDEAQMGAVIEEGKNVLYKHIQSDIYGAYTPKPGGWVGGSTYVRRNSLSKGSLVAINDPDGTITITSTAVPGNPVGRGSISSEPGSLLQLIEGDRHGLWRGGFPRPAVGNAQKEIDSGALMSAIEKALQ